MMMPSELMAPAPVGRSAAWKHRPSPFEVLGILLGIGASALVLYPILLVVNRTLWVDGHFTLAPFREVLDDPALPEILKNTSIVASTSTIIAVLVACGFAWLNERTDARIGWLARVLPLVPLLIPAAAGAFGWLALMAPRAGLINVWLNDHLGWGPINIASLPGLVFLYTIFLMPFAYVVIQPAFQNLDPSLEEAARVSGATTLRVLFRVTLPAIFPTIIMGALLSGVISLALFSIPVIIGSPAGIDVLSTRVYRYLTASFPAKTGSALALTSLVLVLALIGLAVQRVVARRGRHASIVGKSARSTLVALGPWRHVGRLLMFGYLLVSAVIPFLGLVYLSLQSFWSAKISFSGNLDNYARLLEPTNPTRTAIVNSLVLSATTATVVMALATVIATFVHRSRSKLAAFVDGTTKLPATMSELVLGIGVLLAFSGAPFYLSGTKTILMLGYMIAFLTLATIAANAAIGQISNELVEAAGVSGARHGRVFGRVQFPLMLPGLIGGWILVFVAIIGDVTMSALLAGPATPVIGFRLLDLQTTGDFTQLSALGVMVTITTMTTVIAVTGLLNRRRQAF